MHRKLKASHKSGQKIRTVNEKLMQVDINGMNYIEGIHSNSFPIQEANFEAFGILSLIYIHEFSRGSEKGVSIPTVPQLSFCS